MSDHSTDPKDLEQLRKVIEGVDIAMVTTHDADDPTRLVSRPLSTQTTETDGDVLFLTQRSGSFVRDITRDPQVNVAYAGKGVWVSLAGRAQVVEDRALVEQFWSAGAAAFMEGGPENPDNVVVRVEGDTAELWGGQSKVATAVKMVRAMTGNRDDDGTKVIDLP
ncbi:pyridoxamine 5'-phosphate oxidase family protein [Mariniluteicoccus endophyticus]